MSWPSKWNITRYILRPTGRFLQGANAPQVLLGVADKQQCPLVWAVQNSYYRRFSHRHDAKLNRACPQLPPSFLPVMLYLGEQSGSVGLLRKQDGLRGLCRGIVGAFAVNGCIRGVFHFFPLEGIVLLVKSHGCAYLCGTQTKRTTRTNACMILSALYPSIAALHVLRM